MAELNFWSCETGEDAYEIILGEYSGSKGAWEQQGVVSQGTAYLRDTVYSNLEHGGWVFQGANGFPSLKPDVPRLEDRDGKDRLIKYESPYHCQHDLFMPNYTIELWQQILGDAWDSTLSQEQLWALAGGLGLQCFLTEGAKKTVAIACQGYLALGIPGKDNWRTSYKGTGKVVDSVTNKVISRPNERILDVLNQFQIIYAFDQDAKASTRKSVQKSLNSLAHYLHLVPMEITWDPELGKGVDDILYAGTTMSELLSTQKEFQVKLADNERADEVASKLAGRYLCTGGGRWYQYNPLRGTWRVVPVGTVKQAIGQELKAIQGRYSAKELADTWKLLDHHPRIYLEQLTTNPSLIAFTNGVLDLGHEGGFRQAQPADRLTDRLPFAYDPEAQCPAIMDWLNFVSGGDSVFIQTLRAFYNSILFGRFEYQKFMELVGVGGSGKGTALRLARLLVGRNYCVELDPKRLGDRFEMAAIEGAKLVTISDAPPVYGDMTTFRMLTGMDAIRREEKGVTRSAQSDFIFQGMVLIAAHKPFGTDGSSGMMRRRISLAFDRKPTGPTRTLISIINREEGWDVKGDFAADLPGFFNWVVSMDPAQVEYLIANDGWESSHKLREQAKMISRSGLPVLEWIHECATVDPRATAQWGKATHDEHDCDFKLYPNYVRWCKETGNNPLKLSNFKENLHQTVQEEFGLQLEDYRNAQWRGLKGLKVRDNIFECVYGILQPNTQIRYLDSQGVEFEGIIQELPNAGRNTWIIWVQGQSYSFPALPEITWVNWNF
ncbi:MAG: DUF3854 domain-containing protein [Candidatus Nanopelagicaceae bacterium]